MTHADDKKLTLLLRGELSERELPREAQTG